MKYYLIFTAICFSLLSCEFSVKTYEKKSEKQNSKIRNGIQIQAKGIKVEQAFLLNEDGTLVPEDNKIEVKQKVKLRLISNGWTEKEGKVYLDAAEKVTTDKGKVMLDISNLFQRDSIQSISVEDSKYLNLSFWLNEVTELFDYITVEFRVWDKMGEGEIKGSYKVYLK